MIRFCLFFVGIGLFVDSSAGGAGRTEAHPAALPAPHGTATGWPAATTTTAAAATATTTTATATTASGAAAGRAVATAAPTARPPPEAPPGAAPAVRVSIDFVIDQHFFFSSFLFVFFGALHWDRNLERAMAS